MDKEIVIAAYDKDLSWMSNLNTDIKQTIYRKGVKTDNGNEIFIENNNGRCVHTFFNHIYKNYDVLSDITFFAQDYPFDHWEDLIEVINNETWVDRCALEIEGYYGFHFNTIKVPGPKGGIMWNLSPSIQHTNGYVLICQSNGFPQDRNPKINVDSYWVKLFTDNKPPNYEFIPGGHFGVTKESIKVRDKEFYHKIVKLLESDETSPWMIERLECYIFNKNFN